MLFTYGRFLSRQLVNTVTSDKLLYKLVSGLIKYQMFICYFLYIAGNCYFMTTAALGKSGILLLIWRGRLCSITSYSQQEPVYFSP
jgi:hypothetical protein